MWFAGREYAGSPNVIHVETFCFAGEKWSPCFFLRVDMWEKKTIKAWYLFSTLMNWPYQLLLLQVFFGGFITVTRHRDGVFLCAWSIFVGFCWQALRPKPQLHYHFSSGLCVSWSDFSKGKVFAVVNFWIPQKSHGFSSLTIYHKH